MRAAAAAQVAEADTVLIFGINGAGGPDADAILLSTLVQLRRLVAASGYVGSMRPRSACLPCYWYMPVHGTCAPRQHCAATLHNTFSASRPTTVPSPCTTMSTSRCCIAETAALPRAGACALCTCCLQWRWTARGGWSSSWPGRSTVTSRCCGWTFCPHMTSPVVCLCR